MTDRFDFLDPRKRQNWNQICTSFAEGKHQNCDPHSLGGSPIAVGVERHLVRPQLRTLLRPLQLVLRGNNVGNVLLSACLCV